MLGAGLPGTLAQEPSLWVGALFWSQSLSAPGLGMLKGAPGAKHYSEGAWNAPLECSQSPLVGPRNSHHTHTRPEGIRP